MKQLLLIYFWLFSSHLLAATFVNSEEDFFIHMKNHVQNVRILTDSLLELAEKDPEMRTTLGLKPGQLLTPELKQLTKEFLGVHDASKINTSKEFLERYASREPLIKELYSIYGKTFAQMTEKEKSIIQTVINGTDAKERERFLQRKNLTNEQTLFMDQVEKLADGVERGSNPVTSEEMAKKVLTMTEMQEKDLARAKTPEEIATIKKKIVLSKKLEELYPKVTTPFNDFKLRASMFKSALEKAGIMPEYLDKYSLYQIMSDYEDLKGTATPKAEDLKKYFFENSDQLKKVQLMVKSTSVIEGMMMLDFVKIEYAKQRGPHYDSRYTRLYETLAGECEK